MSKCVVHEGVVFNVLYLPSSLWSITQGGQRLVSSTIVGLVASSFVLIFAMASGSPLEETLVPGVGIAMAFESLLSVVGRQKSMVHHLYLVW